MCLEVYSTDQDIEIWFEQEAIQFTSPTEFIGRYLLLIHNPGTRPLDTLTLMYPRYIMDRESVEQDGKQYVSVSFNPVKRRTDLPTYPPGYQPLSRVGDVVTMSLADPNNPVHDFPLTLSGVWDSSNPAPIPVLPGRLSGVPNAYLITCRDHNISAWQMKLPRAIPPGANHWFQWEIRVDNAGVIAPDSVIGPTVFHELASPYDVRRTFRERLESDRREVLQQQRAGGIEQLKLHLRTLDLMISELALDANRRAEIKYYELTIETGDPTHRMLMFCTSQGDIRMRSGNPRVVPIYSTADTNNPECWEPIYEWKSGTLLEPTASPWRGLGFSLRFALVCERAKYRAQLLAQALRREWDISQRLQQRKTRLSRRQVAKP